MPYHVSIDLHDEDGFCLNGVEDPKKFVAAAKKEGGIWLGTDAFLSWDTVSSLWFTDEKDLPPDTYEEVDGNKVQTIN